MAILLALRLEEIAHFVSFGAEFKLILLFTLFQIPYILPIAIPISCLIAAILVMQKMSEDQELTAIRAAGLSLKEIAFPLLLTTFAISLFNIYCVSEIATLSHHQTNILKNELRSVNPLLLLHNKHLIRTKGLYFDTLGPSKLGQTASDIILAMPDEKEKALRLLLSKKLSVGSEEISADSLTFLTKFGESKPSSYSNILAESIEKAKIPLNDFAELLENKISKITPDSLKMDFLLLRLKEVKALQGSVDKESPEGKENSREIKRLMSEIVRRLSLGVSPFALTLLGLAFGMSISRMQSKWSLSFPIGFAALFLASFFAAKAFEQRFVLSMLLYTLPQMLIIIASIWKMERISKGVSS